MTTTVAPICLGCSHLRSSAKATCDAYPQGIPLAVWLSAADHRRPLPNDRGYRYVGDDEYPALVFGETPQTYTGPWPDGPPDVSALPDS